MPTARPMPYSNFNFRVEISGVEAGYFKGVDGLSAELEAIGASKIPGMHKAGNVTLKRGVIGASPRSFPGSITLYDLTPSNPVGAKLLYDWYRATPAMGGGLRKDLTVVVLNRANQPLARLKLQGAVPKSWELSTGANGSAVGGMPPAFKTKAEGGLGIGVSSFTYQKIDWE